MRCSSKSYTLRLHYNRKLNTFKFHFFFFRFSSHVSSACCLCSVACTDSRFFVCINCVAYGSITYPTNYCHLIHIHRMSKISNTIYLPFCGNCVVRVVLLSTQSTATQLKILLCIHWNSIRSEFVSYIHCIILVVKQQEFF